MSRLRTAVWQALALALALTAWHGRAAAAPPILDPNRAEFPDSSLVDYAPLVPHHTLDQGFLKADREGHFVWQNGSRARFWGINVASDSVFQPLDRIETCLQRISRAGFNLVRIHHIDGAGRGILLTGGAHPTFDADKLKCVDYWVDRCGKLGISVYLDLLDYRSFNETDGIPNPEILGRGAKPYALFDDELVVLQQAYAKAFLREHVNSYNGKAYADDPAVVMVELFDENGLFIKRRDWPLLAEPYRTRLKRRWNEYLLERYGSTDSLAAAWGRSGAVPPFPLAQRLENWTLDVPQPGLGLDVVATTPSEKLQRAVSSDAARFAYRVHRTYYRVMRDYLRRELQVKVPISAVGDFSLVPDLLAVSQELDFVGTNFYWDHPVFRNGRMWQMPFIFHYWNAMGSTSADSFAPVITMSRMHRKPLVVREWNYCYPNPYRASGMVEAAAYAALQDVDAMILFTYGTLPRKNSIGWFDCQADPCRWGLAGVAGSAFLNGTISPARRRIDLGYSDVDTFMFKQYDSELRNLGWVSRLSNRCFDRQLNADADLTLASGRSAAAEYQGGPLLLCRNDPSVTTAGDALDTTSDFYGYPAPLTAGAAGNYTFDGSLMASAGAVSRGAGGRFPLQALGALGARPLGVGATDALGFWDPQRRVAGFGPLETHEQVRAALDLLALLYNAPVSRDDDRTERYVSDTGELVRDAERGRLTIAAAQLAGVAGDLRGGPFTLGPIRIETGSTIGAILLASLDGQSLAETQRFVVKQVTVATNTGMVVSAPGPQNDPANRWIVDAEGIPPVRTNGRSNGGLRIYRGGRLLCGMDLTEGTAEIVRDATGWRVFCDTPNIRLTLPGTAQAWSVESDGRESDLGSTMPNVVYPQGAVLVRAQ